jgi:hypothetical protein
MSNKQKILATIAAFMAICDILEPVAFYTLRNDVAFMRKQPNLDNIMEFNLRKYTVPDESGTGILSKGARQISSAMSAIGSSLVGSSKDSAGLDIAMDMRTLFQDIYDAGGGKLVVEIMAEAFEQWEKMPQVRTSLPLQSLKQFTARKATYLKLLNENDWYTILSSLYLICAPLKGIHKALIHEVTTEHQTLVDLVKSLLENKLKDAEMPKVLLEIDAIVKRSESRLRAAPVLKGGRRKNSQ